jgi:hypothetical protein
MMMSDAVSRRKGIFRFRIYLRKIYRLLFSNDSYLKETGLLNSYRQGYPCDNNGDPLPWMTYPIISIIKERFDKEMNVFEYGSGFSTLYYAKLVRKIVSVECDRDWYEKIQSQLPGNASLIYCGLDKPEEYVKSIDNTNEVYDVIIVDGRERVKCLENAVQHLSDEGIIILDDSNRQKYINGIDFLKKNGFKQLELEGMKPNTFRLTASSIFYRNDNCVGL